MLGLLANTTGALIALALVFTLLIGAVLAIDHPEVKRVLCQLEPYRRFERLAPVELRFRGMVSLGIGMCSFAMLLTLKLILPDMSVGAALSFGVLTVVAVTVGAALLERAAHLDGWR